MLNKRFVLNGGKDTSSVENTLDTDKHKIQRIEWMRQHYFQLTNPYIYVAYMDEKFFYSTTRRRKIKIFVRIHIEK